MEPAVILRRRFCPKEEWTVGSDQLLEGGRKAFCRRQQSSGHCRCGGRWSPTSAAGRRGPELCRPRAPRSRTYPTGRCALPASTEPPRELRGDVHLWGHLPPRPSLSHLTCGFVLAGRGNDSLFLSQAFSADSKNKPAIIKLQM